MALARVVAFEGVTADRIAEIKNEMASSGGPPEGLPATELLILHDPQAEKSIAIVFFDNEDDYAKGDAVLGGMPTDETPGRRLSVDKYDVAVHMTATPS